MKTFRIKYLFIALAVLFTGADTYAQITKADIVATGLTCSMCSNAINKQLAAMPQVDKVTTDLNTNTFRVFFKDDAVVQPVALKDAVEKAGFFVGSMALTMKVDAQKVKDNTRFETGGGSFVFMDKKPVVGVETSYKVLNKGFVTQKEYQKLAKSYAQMASYTSGKSNDYHVISLPQ